MKPVIFNLPPRALLLFGGAIFLLCLAPSPLRADSKEEKARAKQLAAVTKTLRKMFLDRFPGIIEADPTKLGPADWDAAGIDPSASFAGMDELRRKYPSVLAKEAEGRAFREDFGKSLDKKSDPILDKSAVNRRKPTEVYRSYLNFLESQKSKTDAPLPVTEIHRRAYGDTFGKYAGETAPTERSPRLEIDWTNPNANRYYQKRVRAREEERVKREAFEPKKENFDGWKSHELSQIDKALLQNYRAAYALAVKQLGVKVVLLDGKKTPLTEKQLASLEIQMSPDVNLPTSTSPIRILVDGQPTSVLFEGESIASEPLAAHGQVYFRPLQTLGSDTDALLAAQRRISLLNLTLREQREALQAAQFEEDPRKLKSSLERSARVQQTERDRSESLLKAPFGSAASMHDLIWWRKKMSPNEYGKRRVLAQFNLAAVPLQQSAEGRKQRKHFWAKFIAIAGIVAGGELGARELYVNGTLDPAINAIHHGANQVYDKALEPAIKGAGGSIQYVYDRAGDLKTGVGQGLKKILPFGAGSGDSPGFSAGSKPQAHDIASDEEAFKKIPLYEIDGDQVSNVKVLDLATSFDLKPEEMKPLELSKSGDNISIVTRKVHFPENGMVGLPRARSFDLSSLDVYDQDKKKLTAGTDYTLMKSRFGIPIVRLTDPSKVTDISFRAGYSEGTPWVKETFLFPDRLQPVVTQLKEAGFKAIGKSLQSEIDLATKEGRYIWASTVSTLLNHASVYTYYPNHDPYPVPEGNPFGPLTSFLDENGVFCTQCSDIRELAVQIYKAADAGEGFINAEGRTVITRESGTALFNLPLHANVALADGDGADGIVEFVDPTPFTLDSKGPYPMKSAGQLAEAKADVKANHARILQEMRERARAEAAAKDQRRRVAEMVAKEEAEKLKAAEKKKAAAQKTPSTPEKHTPEKKLAATKPVIPPAPKVPEPASPKGSHEAPNEIPLSVRVMEASLIEAPHRTRVEGPKPIGPLVGAGPGEFNVPPKFALVDEPDSITPNLEAITRLQDAFKNLTDHSYFQRIAERTKATDAAPSTAANNLARAVLRYAREGHPKFADLARAIQSISPGNPELRAEAPSDLRRALAAAAIVMENRVTDYADRLRQHQTRTYPELANTDFLNRIILVFKSASEEEWTPRGDKGKSGAIVAFDCFSMLGNVRARGQ